MATRRVRNWKSFAGRERPHGSIFFRQRWRRRTAPNSDPSGARKRAPDGRDLKFPRRRVHLRLDIFQMVLNVIPGDGHGAFGKSVDM